MQEHIASKKADPPEPPPGPQAAVPFDPEDTEPPVLYKQIDGPADPKNTDPPVFYEAQPPASIITDEQLRALSRKHLLMMIRDLEKELLQAKQERDSLLIAYKAGLAKKGRTY